MKNLIYKSLCLFVLVATSAIAYAQPNIMITCPGIGCGADDDFGAAVHGEYADSGLTDFGQPIYVGPVGSDAYRLKLAGEMPMGAPFFVYRWEIQDNATGSVIYFSNTGLGLAPFAYPGDITDWTSFNSTLYNDPPTSSAFLPVELTSFTAKADKENVVLNWQTASESNNEGFEVEHSTDGREWTYIDFVNGQGDSDEVNNYAFVDEKPVAGHNYYRLRQLDFDGLYAYSDVVGVKFDNRALEIFPNPVKNGGSLQIRLEDEDLTASEVRITDSAGRLVQSVSLAYGASRIQLPNLQQGIYYVSLITEGSVYQEKIMVK